MLRLSVFFLFIAMSWQASALTFKSGESIDFSNSSHSGENAKNADKGLLEAQRLLQKFSFIKTPPTGRWNKRYVDATKSFYQNDFGRNHNGAYSLELLAHLKKRRLVMPPLQAGTEYAEEIYDISSLGVKSEFGEDLAKTHFRMGHFGFTAISSTEMASPFCYPTPSDCYESANTFAPAPHNAIHGDFNGDGYEDLAISWIYNIHTIPRFETPSHIRFYLNDGTGKLISTPSIYKDNIMPLRHYIYRLSVADFNGDGFDDLFAGTMGVIKRIKDIGYITEYEPHVLLLSDGEGKLYDASTNIEGQELGGLIMEASFAHTNSVGDINCDGHPDIYAGGILLINDGSGFFTNDTNDLPNSLSVRASRPWSASTIADFNLDGCGDLAAYDLDGNGHAWISVEGHYKKRKIVELNILHNYGADNMKANDMVAGDLDGDGIPELVVTIHRKKPYYLGRRVAVLKYVNGSFTDVSKKSIYDPRDKEGQNYLQAHGAGSIKLLDQDDDGDLDIIDSHGGSWEENGRFGITIFTNDSRGKFEMIPQDKMVMLQEHMISGMEANRVTLGYGYPINLDNLSGLDYVSFVRLPWQKDKSGWIGYTVFSQ